MRAGSVYRLLFQLLVLLPLAVVAAKDKKKDKSQPQALQNVTIDRLVNLRTHSAFAPYIDQDLQNRWWDFGADSYINTNKHIRLTRNKPSQMGWLWSRLPLTASNFVIEVEFKISGDSTHLFGDGMAIWLTKKRAEPGPVFGSIDEFEGLGIFIDTYANARHTYSFPRIMAMMGDGKTKYNHDLDGDTNSLGGCSANVRRTNVPTKIQLTYIKDRYLDVKLQYKAWNEWTDCFRLDGFSLPQSPFVGFSALTGDVYDSHDIISVSTSSAILADPKAPKDKLQSGSSSATSGSWTWFLIKLFLFGGVCAGALYGYQEYSRRNGFGGGSFNRRRGGGIDMWSSGKRF